MKRYFYITLHFTPVYEGTVLRKRKDGLFVEPETGEVYRKRFGAIGSAFVRWKLRY